MKLSIIVSNNNDSLVTAKIANMTYSLVIKTCLSN